MKKLLLVLLLLVVYPAYSQDYTVTQVEVKPPLQNIYETGGTNLNLADDGMATNISIGFDFEFYGNTFNKVNISNNGFITFTGLNSACCQGQLLPSPFMDNSIMALWTDLISVNGMNPYYKSYILDGENVFTVGWYNTLEFYNQDAVNTFEITLYEGSNNILFNYENLNVYGHALTAGIQGTDGQFEQIYFGNSTQSLANSAYLFTYTPAEPEDPIAPNCITNPTYIDCIIDSTPDPIYTVDDNTSNNEDIPVAETNEPNNEPTVIGGEVDLESLLAQNSEQSEEIVEEDEEKEEELKDEISSDILQQALATTEFLQDGISDRERNTARGLIDEKESTDSVVIDNTIESEAQEIVVENTESKETIVEETVTETEKVLVAENTEVETKEESTVEESVTSVQVEQTLVNAEQETTTELVVEETETVELPVFVQNQTETVVETISIENVDGTVDSETFVANQVEQALQLDNEITNEVITNTVTQASEDELFVENIVNETLQQQQKTFAEEQTDEQLTMEYVQPGVFASITPYNVEPNISDKEASGVLGKTEEKSDAEKRAEEVIAANAKEQEEINKNYMEADQSGIVAAMGADTDVNAYRSRMLNDNNIWYKPEDIYKNVVYKDNVRGSYFLEKGNSDTYKKMVEEQYK